MPILAGQPYYDASGNAITDASGNAIGEPDLPISLLGGFLVSSPSVIPWGPIAGAVLETLGPWLLEHFFGDDPNGSVDLTQMATDTARLRDDGTIGQLLDNLNGDHDAILTAIGNIQTSGGLTTEEHDALMGLSNVDYDQIASAVWGYTLVLPDMQAYDEGPMAQTVVQNIGYYQTFLAGYVGLPVPDRAFFHYCAKSLWTTTNWLGYWTNTSETTELPELDLSLVVSGDTVWSYLQREYPSYTWLHGGPGSWPIGNRIYVDAGSGEAWYVCTLTDADIRNWWPPASDPAPDLDVDVPPVVTPTTTPTYGDPVALGEAIQIDEAMAGVLIDVTDVGSGVRVYPVGDFSMLYKAGYLAFINPLGYVEEPQFLSFTKGIYVPKTCTEAIGVLVKPNQGQEGTVTPFTLTGA